MKKKYLSAMLIASASILTACSVDDDWTNMYNSYGEFGENSQGGGGSSSTTGALTTFTVAVDKTSAEPSTTVSEYFPDEEDALENNSFTTEVAINMSAPEAKSENGVEVTVSGGHVVANHSSVKNICYVLSGTTTNGSFTVVGDK